MNFTEFPRVVAIGNTTKEAGHGRHETRRVSVCTVIDDLHEIEHWPRLCSIAMVERERTIGDKTSSEKAYYLSSLAVDARKMAHNIRAHWSIENTLHWTLDVVFREDSSRVRSRGAATNMAALRKLVLSLLKLEPSKPGTSMRMKQRICGWKPDYAFDVLRTISRP